MSTSPGYSFLVAWASAASTAPSTTSRSTLFSREMASTSINNSRFMPLLSFNSIAVNGTATPFEAHQRSQARITQFIQFETQCLQRRQHALLAHALPRLHGGLVAPHDLPARLAISTLGTFQRAAKFFPICADLSSRRVADRRLQRHVDHLAGEAHKIVLGLQR